MQIDNHDNLTSINIKQQEIKSLSKLASDSSDSLVSEGPVLDMPPICNWISSNVLGQHGGELLIHFDKFAGILTQKDFFYRPGMILFGTKVNDVVIILDKWIECSSSCKLGENENNTHVYDFCICKSIKGCICPQL